MNRLLYTLYLLAHLFFFIFVYIKKQELVHFIILGNIFLILGLFVLFIFVYNNQKTSFAFFDRKINDYGKLSFVIFHLIYLISVNIAIVSFIFYNALCAGYELTNVITKESLENINLIGGFIGGVIGPLFTLVASLLVFVTLKLQNKQIKDTQEALVNSNHIDTIPYFFNEYESIKSKLNQLIYKQYIRQFPNRDFFNYSISSIRKTSIIINKENIDAEDLTFLTDTLFPNLKIDDYKNRQESAKEKWEKRDRNSNASQIFFDFKLANDKSYKFLLSQYDSIIELLVSQLHFADNTDTKNLIGYQNIFLKKITQYELLFIHLFTTKRLNKSGAFYDKVLSEIDLQLKEEFKSFL